MGRDYITVGYYLEIFFPSNNVRFVSINDQFDTTNGITNRDKSAYIQSRTRIPFIITSEEKARKTGAGVVKWKVWNTST